MFITKKIFLTGKGLYEKFYPSFSEPVRTIEDMNKVSEHSLLKFFSNVYSQLGQDGILREIIKRLNINKGYFCEFGAWDGVMHCNTRWLYENGWQGIYIEPSRKKYEILKKNLNHNSTDNLTKCYQGLVGTGTQNDKNPSLDLIIKKLWENKNINLDLLVIDIDGYDLEVFEASELKPKIILMEGGSNFNPTICKPFPLFRIYQHPLGYIELKMREKGYSLVCFLQDCYFIRNDLLGKFEKIIANLSIKDMYFEHYHFRGQKNRKDLLEMRSSSKEIIEFEKSILGSFEPDPTI